MKRRSPGLYVVATALILAIGIPSAAVGFGEGRDAKLGKRNPSSGSLTRETQIIANNGSYGTRQSNKRNGEGGGAIYGCRSNAGKEPCVRANNLKGGRAFEFVDRRQGGRRRSRSATPPPRRSPRTPPARSPTSTPTRSTASPPRSSPTRATSRFASVKADGTFVAGRGATASTKSTSAREHLHRDVQQGRLEVLVHGRRASGGSERRRRLRRRRSASSRRRSLVDEPDTAGGGAGRDFHLQVIC